MLDKPDAGLASSTSHVGQATVLSLPDISAFDEGTATGKSIVAPIFNHRNFGHKLHARPCMIKFKINIGQRDQVSFNILLGGRPPRPTYFIK
jgi:hypothetical protein